MTIENNNSNVANSNAPKAASAGSSATGFSQSTPPTAEQMRKADGLAVLDERGKKCNFRELYGGGEGEGGKTIVLVIRHFYCGLCQDFISYLITKLTPSSLLAANAKLIIIGCGSYELIKPYRELLGCPFEIYTDPTKELYGALGMTLRTLAQGESGKEPEYLKRSALGNIFGSILNAFRFGKLHVASGDIKQLGGEFVFDSEGNVLYTHRMENTKGHGPIADFARVAGVKID